MRAAGREFEWEVYNMAPHAFFRDGSMVSTSRAAMIAWELVLDFLDRHMSFWHSSPLLPKSPQLSLNTRGDRCAHTEFRKRLRFSATATQAFEPEPT